jgi:hypothetical protein
MPQEMPGLLMSVRRGEQPWLIETFSLPGS